jgi:CRISPR-associated protein Cas2
MERQMERIKKELPSRGSVRALPVTDKQYARMRFLLGEPTKNEQFVTTHQLTLF